MRSLFRLFAPLLISAALTTGCVSHARVYVPYNYFSWNNQEAIFYPQWEHDTGRDHLDFTLRSNADMNLYFKWRQSHGDQH
jgi:hypothetical protein